MGKDSKHYPLDHPPGPWALLGNLKGLITLQIPSPIQYLPLVLGISSSLCAGSPRGNVGEATPLPFLYQAPILPTLEDPTF